VVVCVKCTAASYVGLKKELLPPYLDPSLTNIEELMTGVSFASAGSGFDPLTPTITVFLFLSLYELYCLPKNSLYSLSLSHSLIWKIINIYIPITNAKRDNSTCHALYGVVKDCHS